MELFLYPRLGTRSRRALLKTKKRFGRNYHYSPRGDLVKRLSEETGMPIEQVYRQLYQERAYLLELESST